MCLKSLKNVPLCRFSGIKETDLAGVRTTLRDVQAQLLFQVAARDILVGHSLESDLRAVKLLHSRVVDTAIVFPHKMGPPYKRALRTLAVEQIQRIIQNDGGSTELFTWRGDDPSIIVLILNVLIY